MGAEVTKFETGKYYKIAGDVADLLWGAKVIRYEDYRPLKFKVVVKAGDGVVVNYEGGIKAVDGAQTVRFGPYTLKADEKITDQAVIDKMKAQIDGVSFVKKRGIDERWKNAEKNGEIINIDAVDGGVTQPAKKKTKREFITELFKELRF